MNLGRVKTKKSQISIVGVFGVAAAIVLVVVLYFSFSSAKVTVTPKAVRQEVSFQATVDQNPNLDPRKIETISGRIISKESDGSKEIGDIGTKTIEEKATGTVTLINSTSNSQPLLATTQLINADGIKFRTNSRVVVPANGSVSVGVTADQPGASGNIEPGRFTIIKLWKGLQNQIYGESSEAMTGGTREVEVVTDEDVENAKNELAAELYDSLIADIKSEVSEGEKLLDDAIRKEVIEFSSSVEPGEETNSFSITEKVRVTAVVFDEESLLELAVSKLRTEIAEGRDIASQKTDDLSYTVSDYDINTGTAELDVDFNAITILKLSNEIFDESKIFGFTQEEATEYFLQYPDIEKVDVRLSPPWNTKIPNIEDKVDITIEDTIELPDEEN